MVKREEIKECDYIECQARKQFINALASKVDDDIMGMIKQEEIRRIIRRVISNYCDGTYDGLGNATFVEYSEGRKLPQECAEEMESEILKYLEPLIENKQGK